VVVPSIGTKLNKEGINNYWGTIAGSGMTALWTDYLNYPYASSADTSVVSNPIDLSNSNIYGAKLDFNVSCDTEARTSDWKDYLTLSVYDGVNWVELDKFDETKLGDELFHPEEYDLLPYLNGQFKFKFNWKTDAQKQ